MHVITQRRPWSRDIEVYISTQTPTGRMCWYPDGDVWQQIEVPAGEEADPSLVLPDQLAGALAEALLDYVGPSTAMENHLKDTIKVRDRLLTMAEDASTS